MNPHALIPLIDLTSLNESDTDASIRALCKKAVTPYGSVAALCVYPRFVSIAVSDRPDPAIKVATVINFPGGNQPIQPCIEQIHQASHAGADEMDVVLPYSRFLKGDVTEVTEFVQAIRHACKRHTLKLIVESGTFPSAQSLIEACQLCIACGVDFIKTSTGKSDVGATPEAVATILTVLRQHPQIGLKISGGVRTLTQAENYYAQVQKAMGDAWITPQHLRFGASQLLQTLIDQ